MNSTKALAKNLREVHFGRNWTGVCMKETLANVDRELATKQLGDSHSIATLVFHMNYYVAATLKVFQGGPLKADDEFSFDAPAIESATDWQELVQKSYSDAEALATFIEQMPEQLLWEDFVEPKNSTYHRCLHGLVEHCHYHLGQIALLKSALG